jgi:hypothetical protein
MPHIRHEHIMTTKPTRSVTGPPILTVRTKLFMGGANHPSSVSTKPAVSRMSPRKITKHVFPHSTITLFEVIVGGGGRSGRVLNHQYPVFHQWKVRDTMEFHDASCFACNDIHTFSTLKSTTYFMVNSI